MKTTPRFYEGRHNGDSEGSSGSLSRSSGRAYEAPRPCSQTKVGGAHGQAIEGHESNINVGRIDRLISVIGGAALLTDGVLRRSWPGTLLALLGGALIVRGVRGHSPSYKVLGINTAEKIGIQKGVKGIKVEKSIRIDKSPEELFQFWRNFENLARFMKHLKSVKILDYKRSHWIAKAPAGTTVEWDAEIIKEEENHMIAWRSLASAEVKNAGSVYFESDARGRGTVVRVILNYEPPAGRLGAVVAKLFGEEPAQQIEEDLHRFKKIMELDSPHDKGVTGYA
ncbi:MAG: SRPBCC family protein [Gammaproteobacteria bacterium]